MSLRLMVAASCSSLLAFLGCAGEPPVVPVVPVNKLTFPVVVIHEGQSTEFNLNASDLGVMRVERYSTLSDLPLVIDSSGRVCEMRDVQGQRGGLWIMMNPTGQMPIEFTLVERKETGLKAARTLLLSCKYLGRNLESDAIARLREAVEKAATVADMIQLIRDGVPETEDSATESKSVDG